MKAKLWALLGCVTVGRVHERELSSGSRVRDGPRIDPSRGLWLSRGADRLALSVPPIAPLGL